MRKSPLVLEVDLHGYSLSGALTEVERELNHTFCQEEKRRAIHFVTGFGSVLRPGVRNYLLEHPLVRELSVDGPSVLVDLWENREP